MAASAVNKNLSNVEYVLAPISLKSRKNLGEGRKQKGRQLQNVALYKQTQKVAFWTINVPNISNNSNDY